MGFEILDLIAGFVDGYNRARAQAGGHVERLCAELGWPIDEHKGNRRKLDFHDSVRGKRPVYVFDKEDGTLRLLTFCDTFFDPRDVPPEVFAYQAARNQSLRFGKWFTGDEGGEIFFGLEYSAFAEGVSAQAFKTICEQMVAEAATFDERMKKAGLL